MTEKTQKGCMLVGGIFSTIIIIFLGMSIWAGLKVYEAGKELVEIYQPSSGLLTEAQALNTDYPFLADSTGTISIEQIESFIAVKKSFSEKIRTYKSEFEEIEAQQSFTSGMEKLKEAAEILKDVRYDFIDALRAHKMSLNEYAHLSGVIYKTYLGNAATQMPDINIKIDGKDVTEIPPETRVVLDKFRDELEVVETWGWEFLSSAPLFDTDEE